jgi:hypothetical protein
MDPVPFAGRCAEFWQIRCTAIVHAQFVTGQFDDDPILA